MARLFERQWMKRACLCGIGGPGLDFIEIGFKSSLISYILEINSLITAELIDKCIVYHFKEDISHGCQ
jgi:hypothetical protein